MVAAVVNGAAVIGVGTAGGWLVGGRLGAMVGGLVSLAPAVRYALAVRRCRPYPRTAVGSVLLAIDVTWSALNTWAGALFVLVLGMRRNRLDPDRSVGSAVIHLCDPAIPGYATTVGIVVAGCTPRVLRHERVHVFQARLLGPFYLPLVGIGFIVATVVPYWLMVPSARRSVRDLQTYFVRGVYPHTWHEWWAYRVAPSQTGPDRLRRLPLV